MAKYIEADKYLNYLHSREADFLDDYGKGWVAGICTAQRSAKHFFVEIDDAKKHIGNGLMKRLVIPLMGMIETGDGSVLIADISSQMISMTQNVCLHIGIV